MLSPLQLRHHAFEEVTIKVVDTGSAKGEVTFEQQFQCGPAVDNPLVWRGDLRVTMTPAKDKPFSYSGTVSIRGIFEIHPDFPESRREELIRVNGASLLFGAIREMVLNITSRSLKGPIIFPTISFREPSEPALKSKKSARAGIARGKSQLKK